MIPKRYKLISPCEEWIEDNGEKMQLGRIISEDEILNKRPFSYWLKGQEEDWEEIIESPKLEDVYAEKIEIANKDNSFPRFIFTFENQKYLVELEHGHKWSNPVKIIEL
jgi:hypothetical protein